MSAKLLVSRIVRRAQYLARLVAASLRRFAVWKFLGFAWRLGANYVYDLRRYLVYSGTFASSTTEAAREARFIAQYHKIEHGLSLKETRIGFGRNVVDELVSTLEEQKEKQGRLSDFERSALHALFCYYEFNSAHGYTDEELYRRLNVLAEEQSYDMGGVELVRKQDIRRTTQINFRDFVASRHSIRNFAAGEVDPGLIEEAVSIARGTPSVSNRQAWRVHVYSGALRAKVLQHQDGNRGFGYLADKVLIITADLQCFFGVEERNQCFIDGGMFAMSLLYALHSLGVGACCLGWCVTHDADRALHSVAGIPDSETLIMLMAVGHLPDRFYVPRSVRRSVDDVLVLHTE